MFDTPKVTLKVAEARQRDVGRGKVRIDDINMRELGITTGDIIEVRGQRKTGAIVWPAYVEDQGVNIVRVDGIIRRNAQVVLGDQVILRRVPIKAADEVTIAPTKEISLDYGFETYVLRKLLGYPANAGDTILIPILGRSIPFVVSSTKPKGLVIITDNTVLRVSEKPQSVLLSRTGISLSPNIKTIHWGIETLLELQPEVGLELAQKVLLEQVAREYVDLGFLETLFSIVKDKVPDTSSDFVLSLREQLSVSIDKADSLIDAVGFLKILMELNTEVGATLLRSLQRKIVEIAKKVETSDEMFELITLISEVNKTLDPQLASEIILQYRNEILMMARKLKDIRVLIWYVKIVASIDPTLGSELALHLRDRLVEINPGFC